MLGVFKAQGIGNGGDGPAFQQHSAGFFHKIATNVARGAFAGAGADKVAEIVGRKAELAGAVPDTGDAVTHLPPFGIIPFQRRVYLSAEIILPDHLELAFIIARRKFQQKRDIRQDDAPEMGVSGKLHQFLSDSCDAAFQAKPFFLRRKEGFVAIIGKEVIILDESLQGGSRQKKSTTFASKKTTTL